ncbi:a-amylase, partial [Blyttiomyces helicus]
DRFAPTPGKTPNVCNDLSNYCGGTWQGTISQLDYIKGMGFDAIWISPVVVNSDGGYHGYWGRDFYNTNPNFGTRDDLMSLVEAAHGKEMLVMLDLVVNHAGPYNIHDDLAGDTYGASSLYHPQCNINENNQTSVEQCWVAGNLPDIDTENPNNVRTAKDIVKFYTEYFGFDAIRIDTFKHVRATFWPDYLASVSPDVFTTAEILDGDQNYVSTYTKIIPSVINYPLFFAMNRSFVAQEAFPQLQTQIAQNVVAMGPQDLHLTFIDNHDTARFSHVQPDLALEKNALVFTLLGDGIPVVYYGTEQGLTGGNDPANRAPQWQLPGGGFSKQTELYTWMKTTITARKQLGWDVEMGVWVTQNVYAFRRGAGLVVLCNLGSSGSGSFSVVVGSRWADGTTLSDVYSGQTVTVQGGQVQVSVSNGLPMIFR